MIVDLPRRLNTDAVGSGNAASRVLFIGRTGSVGLIVFVTANAAACAVVRLWSEAKKRSPPAKSLMTAGVPSDLLILGFDMAASSPETLLVRHVTWGSVDASLEPVVGGAISAPTRWLDTGPSCNRWLSIVDRGYKVIGGNLVFPIGLASRVARALVNAGYRVSEVSCGELPREIALRNGIRLSDRSPCGAIQSPASGAATRTDEGRQPPGGPPESGPYSSSPHSPAS